MWRFRKLIGKHASSAWKATKQTYKILAARKRFTGWQLVPLKITALITISPSRVEVCVAIFSLRTRPLWKWLDSMLKSLTPSKRLTDFLKHHLADIGNCHPRKWARKWSHAYGSVQAKAEQLSLRHSRSFCLIRCAAARTTICKDNSEGTAHVLRCLQDNRASLDDTCRSALFDMVIKVALLSLEVPLTNSPSMWGHDKAWPLGT